MPTKTWKGKLGLSISTDRRIAIGRQDNFGGAVDIDADVIVVGEYDYINRR